MGQVVSIVKRDGSTEVYMPTKIARVMGAAGLDSQQTEQVIMQINAWIEKLGRNEISSIELRDKLLHILPTIDAHSADLFAWYQKTKE